MPERRHELIAARIRAGYSQEGLAAAIGAGRSTVVRWEHGEATPQASLRAKLRDALGIDDAEMTRLLAGTAPPGTEGDDMDRRQLLGGGLGLGAALLGSGTDSGHARVGRAEIAVVRDTATMITNWTRTYGAGGLPPGIMDTHVQWAASLLHAPVSSELRPELLSAVGYLSGVCGFAAFDSYDHDRARMLFRAAQTCAEEADDWHLRARALNMAARQAIWIDDADTGLTNVELALVRSDRLTPVEVASLHTLRARALARLGRVEDARRAAGAADDAFTRRGPGDADPPWMSYYDAAQHRGDTGHALADCSRAGAATDAAERLAYSVAHHPPEQTRSRVMSQIELADLRLSTGEPEAALEAVEVALVHAAELRSARAADTLGRLHRRALAAPEGRAVVQMRERIGAHFEATA